MTENKTDTMQSFRKDKMTWVKPETTSQEIFNLMKKNNIHHIPVIDNGKAVGIISDRDVSFVRHAGESFDLTAEQIMTPEPYAVDELTSIPHAINVMRKNRINSILIKNNNDEISGIFTSSDALDVLAEHYQ